MANQLSDVVYGPVGRWWLPARVNGWLAKRLIERAQRGGGGTIRLRAGYFHMGDDKKQWKGITLRGPARISSKSTTSKAG